MSVSRTPGIYLQQTVVSQTTVALSQMVVFELLFVAVVVFFYGPHTHTHTHTHTWLYTRPPGAYDMK